MAQTVLITGCSSGFGDASARLFAENGWNVVATMRRPEACVALARVQNVDVAPLDVQDRASIQAAVAAAIAKFGRIDVLINNAGYGLAGIFEATPREKILEQFEVNVFGTMDVTRAILPHFRAQKSGIIVNISSGAGVFGLPLSSLYCASKFALEGFSEALAYELKDLGITVKIIEPGGVLNTGFGKRTADEASSLANLADYTPFVSAAMGVFSGLAANAGATPDDVASVIFAAATDGTDQLRYVATEDIAPMVDARRQTSEVEYIAFMRDRMTPKSA